MSLKSFSIFSSGGYFVQTSTTILAYLVEGQPRDIPVKLFENWSTGLGADTIYKFFYFYLWWPSCLSEWNDFIYFAGEPSRQHSCKV